MNQDELKLFQKICVRTALLDEKGQQTNFGSGTIMSANDKYYVLTAKHCINDACMQDIVIEYYNGYSFKRINVVYIIPIINNDMNDIAVLQIEDPQTNVDYEKIIKRLSLTITEDNYFIFGYPNVARNGRIFPANFTGDNCWTIKVETNYAMTTFKKDMEAISGAGILLWRHERLYYVGIITDSLDSIGSFDDVLTLTPTAFNDYLPDQTIDNDYFSLLDQWDEWEDKRTKIQRAEYIKELNIEWLAYLTKKMNIIYDSESDKMIDTYIKYYIKGVELMNKMTQGNANFAMKLNKANHYCPKKIS